MSVMIAHLRGRLLSKTPNQAIIDCGGVGYDVSISVPTFSALPTEGAEVSLFINTQVREDAIALFGFLHRDEKRLFERLITVSGIGPKLGITVLSGLPAASLIASIRGSDHAQLVRVPGIGKKTADDVLSALVNLGYRREAAQKAIENAIAKHETTELTIRTDFDQLFRYSMQAMR